MLQYCYPVSKITIGVPCQLKHIVCQFEWEVLLLLYSEIHFPLWYPFLITIDEREEIALAFCAASKESGKCSTILI